MPCDPYSFAVSDIMLVRFRTDQRDAFIDNKGAAASLTLEGEE